MQKITPHLWFDKEAKEAAEFYSAIFPNSKVTYVSQVEGTPSGDADIVSMEICGQPFMAISAGPIFKFNPSISFHVKCNTKEEVDAIWAKLVPGGKALMELGTYPFSEHYGWVQDKYGLSWQINFVGDQDIKQKLTPVLMFVGSVACKAEEAANFYASVFKGGQVDVLSRYEEGEEPERKGTVKYAELTLHGQVFGVMDSAREHKFAFNEAISLLIPCETQEEIDYFWSKLSAVSEAEQCGWLKDKFGLSWQVWPTAMGEMMENGNKDQVARLTKAFLSMKKFNIQKLKEAFMGK